MTCEHTKMQIICHKSFNIKAPCKFSLAVLVVIFKHKCFVLWDALVLKSFRSGGGKLSRLRSSHLSSCLIPLLNQMGLRRSRSSTGSSRGTKHPEALAGYFRDVIPKGVQVAAHTVLTGDEISSGTQSLFSSSLCF